MEPKPTAGKAVMRSKSVKENVLKGENKK